MEMTPNAIALPPRSSRRHRRVFVSSPTPLKTVTFTRLNEQYKASTFTEITVALSVADRLTLYEQTFEMYMRADPELTAWIKRMNQKGIPKVMSEGYKSPSLLRKLSADYSSTTCSSKTTRLFSLPGPPCHATADQRGLSSIFLRKASATVPRTPPPQLLLKPCTSASRFISASLSRLSSSLSARRKSSAPTHHQHQLQDAPILVRLRQSRDMRPEVAIQVQ